MSKSSYRKEHPNNVFCRLSAGLFILASCILLCSCRNLRKQEPKGYTVEVYGIVGSGYFWNCSLSQEGIVRVESDQTVPKGLSYGEEYPVTFTFYGEYYGEVQAELVSTRKYDESIRIIKTYDLMVDRNNEVTGEQAGNVVVIDPGETGYSFGCTDSSVISWIDRDDGTYEVTPLREGFVTITLTKTENADSQKKKHVYNLTVSDDMRFVITEQLTENNNGQFDSMAELQKSIGIEMPLPEEARILEIRGLDGMGYVLFRYLDHDFSYVAGNNLDMRQFYGENGKTVVVNGTSVGFPYPDKSLAGWNQMGIGYYVMAEDKIPDSTMLTLLRDIIR